MKIKIPSDIRAVLCLVTALAIPASASVNLIQNGTFDPNQGGGFTEKFAGEDFGTGNFWHVDSGNVDWIGTGFWAGPATGGNSVDLDGSTAGAISQSISTTAGQNYLLTFWLNANPAGGPNPKILNVTAGAASHQYIEPTGPYYNDPAYQGYYSQQSLTFTAGAGSSTTIQFASGDTTDCCWGPVIGDVRVTDAATPEPGFYGVLTLGLAGLMTAIRRRKNI